MTIGSLLQRFMPSQLIISMKSFAYSIFSLITDILSLNEKRPLVQIILKGLLKGKRVTALKAGGDPFSQYWKLKGMDKGPDLLKRKLSQQMAELKMLGIRLIDFNEQADFAVQHVKKTVITDESVRFAHLSKLDQLAVPKGAIITPLQEIQQRN